MTFIPREIAQPINLLIMMPSPPVQASRLNLNNCKRPAYNNIFCDVKKALDGQVGEFGRRISTLEMRTLRAC